MACLQLLDVHGILLSPHMRNYSIDDQSSIMQIQNPPTDVQAQCKIMRQLRLRLAAESSCCCSYVHVYIMCAARYEEMYYTGLCVYTFIDSV